VVKAKAPSSNARALRATEPAAARSRRSGSKSMLRAMDPASVEELPKGTRNDVPQI